MIREFKIEDIDLIKVQPKQQHYTNHVKCVALGGGLDTVYTYEENGKPKAFIGAQPYWKGRCAIWALVGNIDNWVAFHKETKRTLESYCKVNNMVRLELTTEVGFDESERWAKMLGFKYESLMSKFGVHGEDHKMWVIICQQH